MKKRFEKYKDVILYIFFGVCTTSVNVISYWIFAHAFYIGTMGSTIVAWILAVWFAYVTNRKWVFHSKASGKQEIIQEIFSFFGCRIATGIVDWFGMYIFVQILGWHDVMIKFICNVVVIVLNYLASKLIIFRGET